MLPGIIIFIKAFLPNKSIHKKEKRNLRILSVAGIACLMFMITTTLIIHRERTDADLILKYENSNRSRMVLKGLVNQTPAQLKDLREVVLKGKDSQIVAIASDGIAAHGDPVRDVRLLIDADARFYGNDEDMPLKEKEIIANLDEDKVPYLQYAFDGNRSRNVEIGN